jgi:hypothetical protein
MKQDEILALFNGNHIAIQEKVDGKLSCSGFYGLGDERHIFIKEDVTGKHTCHSHINYRELPPDKRVHLDEIIELEGNLTIVSSILRYLDYAVIDGTKLRLEQIYELLEIFSRLPSHFGRERIEGLVIKNYEEQLFGKWINDEFEDHIRENEDCNGCK